jgi:Tfp pilus assembly protein FimT
VKQNSNSIEVHRGSRGVSLVEIVIAILVIMVITSMAIIQLGPSLQDSRSDTAMRQVVDQLRQAREYAISNRRYVQVSFPIAGGQYEVQMTQMNTLTPGAGAANPVLSTVPIQDPLQFLVFASKGDTPDGYGNSAAIVFGGVNGGPPTGMYFQSDGELVNGATFLPINGSIFLGVPGNGSSARAVTVMGTTGRVRGWNGAGTTWHQF